MSDIHNDYLRFKSMLHAIQFSKQDQLYIVGDVFDRSNHEPNPVDLYFQILSLGNRCTVIRGNHDHNLALYIYKYFSLSERKQRKLEPYQYNSFQLLMERLAPADVQQLADTIMGWPLQLEVRINEEKYLLAHAMTSALNITKPDSYYLTGVNDEIYYENGVEGYTSICGHSNKSNHIWKNINGNVYLIDCGCGFRKGKLGCLCLESKEEFYV